MELSEERIAERVVEMLRENFELRPKKPLGDKLTPGQAAEFIGVTTQTLREWEALDMIEKKKAIKGYRFGYFTSAEAQRVKELYNK